MSRIVAVLALLASTLLAEPSVGMKAGDFVADFPLPTIDGKYARVSDFAGKKLVLIHFASW
jgi:hypothetical protein